MVSLSEIRAIAAALPGVDEGPPVPAAHRIAAFKVAGKGFVGVEVGGTSMTVSLPEKEGKALAAEDRTTYEGIYRGGTAFVGLRVDLSRISVKRARELIEASWRYNTLGRPGRRGERLKRPVKPRTR